MDEVQKKQGTQPHRKQAGDGNRQDRPEGRSEGKQEGKPEGAPSAGVKKRGGFLRRGGRGEENEAREAAKPAAADIPVGFHAHPLDMEPGFVIPERPSVDLNYNDFTRESYDDSEKRLFVPKKKSGIPFELSLTPRTQSEAREGRNNDARGSRGGAARSGHAESDPQATGARAVRAPGRRTEGASDPAEHEPEGADSRRSAAEHTNERHGEGQRPRQSGKRDGGAGQHRAARQEAPRQEGPRQEAQKREAQRQGSPREDTPREGMPREDTPGQEPSVRETHGRQAQTSKRVDTAQVRQVAADGRQGPSGKPQGTTDSAGKQLETPDSKKTKKGWLSQRQGNATRQQNGQAANPKPEATAGQESADPGKESLMRPYWLKKGR